MGIQTFDEDRLRIMGRLGFRTTETFGEVVRLGHALGFTISGDLLFNLPGQPLSAMRDDVGRAIEIGLDHISLDHLVMFPGLGTDWSRDPALVASLPPNEVAAHNWLDLRSFLLGRGYYQATLTNFERADFRARKGGSPTRSWASSPIGSTCWGSARRASRTRGPGPRPSR